jgi:hypothetical protein
LPWWPVTRPIHRFALVNLRQSLNGNALAGTGSKVDFKRAAAVVRRSVSDDEVRAYERWNAEYGSFPYDPAPAAS